MPFPRIERGKPAYLGGVASGSWQRILQGKPWLQDGDERASRRQAQTDSAAAARVRSRNTGSLARREPSTKKRQIWAKVINPKTVPVVMRYAFIEIAS